MYQDLLEMERKLDWTTTRKKAEVQDALGRNPTVSKLDTNILPAFPISRRRREPSGCSSATVLQVRRGRQDLIPWFQTSIQEKAFLRGR